MKTTRDACEDEEPGWLREGLRRKVSSWRE